MFVSGKSISRLRVLFDKMCTQVRTIYVVLFCALLFSKHTGLRMRIIRKIDDAEISAILRILNLKKSVGLADIWGCAHVCDIRLHSTSDRARVSPEHDLLLYFVTFISTFCVFPLHQLCLFINQFCKFAFWYIHSNLNLNSYMSFVKMFHSVLLFVSFWVFVIQEKEEPEKSMWK